jgi:hypothetical protein
MPRERSWTDDDLVAAIAESNTFKKTVETLGLHPGSKTVKRVKDRALLLGLDFSHFRGGGRQRGPGGGLRKGTNFTTTTRRDFLKLVDSICLHCGLSEWCGKPLVLQVDHIDGDRRNNDLSNLRLLCPNCHSQTPTWSRQKQNKKNARTEQRTER